MPVTIIVGGQWGDEGKEKAEGSPCLRHAVARRAVDYLSADADNLETHSKHQLH